MVSVRQFRAHIERRGVPQTTRDVVRTASDEWCESVIEFAGVFGRDPIDVAIALDTMQQRRPGAKLVHHPRRDSSELPKSTP